MDIRVKFRDGRERLFEHKYRAGGSWDLSYKLEGNWIVIIDEWGKQIILPMEDIEEVRIE